MVEIKTHEEYMKKIPLEKEGQSVRLILQVEHTPQSERKIDISKGKADFYAYNDRTDSWDFTFTLRNPFIDSAIYEDEKMSYEEKGLGEFFRKNQDLLVAYARLMLENGLLYGMIHSQVGEMYKAYGPKGLSSIYVDDRVPFKGRNKFIRIRDELIRRNPP